MKITLIHYSAPPVVGGVEGVIQNQSVLAKEAGHSVSILAGRGEPFDPNIPIILNPLIDSRNPVILEMKKDLDKGVLPDSFNQLVEELQAEIEQTLMGQDVVIVHNVASLHKNLVLTVALRHLSEKPGAPGFILWHHDLAWTSPRYLEELHEGYPWDVLKTKWSGSVQVVVSDLRRQELSQLQGINPEEIYVVPNGLDFPQFFKLEQTTLQLVVDLNLLDAQPLLLLPVRITPRKNIEMALRILKNLKKFYPSAALVVTGPLGPHNPANMNYYKKLIALRRDLNLGTDAHFLAELIQGYLPSEVIADFYRLADAILLPSFEEGFGIPILEAGISHLPIFCSDIPPLRAIAQEWAVYFSVNERPQVVAEKIVETLDQSSTARMSLHVRREFGWKRIYKEKIEPLLRLAERKTE